MRGLWKFVEEKCKKAKTKQRVFLILNTGIWSLAAFLLGMIISLGLKPFGTEVLWNALLTAGYAGFFPGFIGGCIFLMRNTTGHDWEKNGVQL